MSFAARLKEADVRVLTLDIENAPNIAHVWSLWDNNVSLAQLQVPSVIMSVAAKWFDEKEVKFFSSHHDGYDAMLKGIYDLVNEADFIIGYNSRGFDMKHLNRAFLLAGFPPPKPYKNIDLMLIVKQNFRFVSNKLDHVAEQLGLGNKVSHEGHGLWVKCMDGDEDAWARFKEYNIGDVLLTEKLYVRLRPWITNHPHMGQYTGERHSCPVCGSVKLVAEGTAYANVTSYDQYRCECGAVSRSTVKLKNIPTTRHSKSI